MKMLLADMRSNAQLLVMQAVGLLIGYGWALYGGISRYHTAISAQQKDLPSVCDGYQAQLGDACKVDLREAWLEALTHGALLLIGVGTAVAIIGIIRVALSSKVPCDNCIEPDHIHNEPEKTRSLMWAIGAGALAAIPGFLTLFAATFF